MPATRRKLSAPLAEFHLELDRLVRFDSENQRQFSAGKGKMSKRQLHLLTETIFFYGFRAYEAFLRDVFLLYCFEKRPRSRTKVQSFLRPHDFSHAEELIKSSMPFLDWAAPETIISRSALYLRDGSPIRLPYTSNKQIFSDVKYIRYHLAHNPK